MLLLINKKKRKHKVSRSNGLVCKVGLVGKGVAGILPFSDVFVGVILMRRLVKIFSEAALLRRQEQGAYLNNEWLGSVSQLRVDDVVFPVSSPTGLRGMGDFLYVKVFGVI